MSFILANLIYSPKRMKRWMTDMGFECIKNFYVIQFLGNGFFERIYNFIAHKNVYNAIETETYVRYET